MSTQLLAEIFGPDLLIIVVVVVVVMLFGGSKLPQLARGLGSAAREFRKGISEGDGGTPEDERSEEPRDASGTTDSLRAPTDAPTGEVAPAGEDDPAAGGVGS